MILCELLRLTQPRIFYKALDMYEVLAVFHESMRAIEILKSWGLEDMADFNIFGES